MQIGSNNIRAHVGDFYLYLEAGGWALPGLPSRSAEESDKHLEAGCDHPQAGARGNHSNEIPRRVRLYVSENRAQSPPITRSRKKRKRFWT